MAVFIAQHRWVTITVLGTIVLLGTLLRLYHLEKRTISHPEIYTPGIELPYDLSEPRPRLNLLKVITGAIVAEPHPPAYYVFMLGWTKCFGTSALALRFPSVLFGVASIVLIYLLCTLVEDKLTGILAAGMLAFNGLHIYWSQEARMYSMACFLGLLSTVFFVLIFTNSVRKRIFQFLYLVTTLTGLTTVVYFWPIFATHVLWTITGSWRKNTSWLGLLRFQIFIFILASPLLATAAFQSRRSSYIGEDLISKFVQFLQLGFLFEPDPFVSNSNTMPMAATIFLVLISFVLMALGILSKKKKQVLEIPTAKGPTPVVMTLTGIFVFLCILVFAKLTHATDPNKTILIVSTGSIAVLMPLIDFLLRRYWNQFQNLFGFLYSKVPLLGQLSCINIYLSFLPIAMIGGVSLFVPLFSSRGILLFMPYLIIILCKGLVSIVRYRLAWIVLVAILVIIHAFSVIHNHRRLHSIRDYKALAEKMIPKIQNSDLIFVSRHWQITPMFYYLKGGRYQFIGGNYSESIRESFGSRIWLLCTAGLPMNKEVKDSLKGYQMQERVDAFNIWMLLFVKN